MPVSDGCSPAPELVLMMRPPPARFIAGAAARHRVKAALTLMSNRMFQSSSETSSSGRGAWPATPPALFTSTWIGPFVCASIWPIQAAPAARSRRFTTLVVMPPSRAVSASSSAEISVAKTRAPRWAKVCAMQRPKPWPAPVTATVWPSKRMFMGGPHPTGSGHASELHPVLPKPCLQLVEPLADRAVFPALQGHLAGYGHVLLQQSLDLRRGIAADDDGIDLVVEHDAAAIEVG